MWTQQSNLRQSTSEAVQQRGPGTGDREGTQAGEESRGECSVTGGKGVRHLGGLAEKCESDFHGMEGTKAKLAVFKRKSAMKKSTQPTQNTGQKFSWRRKALECTRRELWGHEQAPKTADPQRFTVADK